MKITTAAQMRFIDKLTIETFGISGLVLMENAGVQIVRCIDRHYGPLMELRVAVLAGKGNNGGDGFVAARYLHNAGARVKVFLFTDKAEITGDAAVNFAILQQMKIETAFIADERDWDKLRMALAFSDVIVDALLGTGFHGSLHGAWARAVDMLNAAGRPVVAVDIPSGVDADTGCANKAVKAAATVTLALPKQGLLMYPGADYAGEISVADIGIPSELLTDESLQQESLTADRVKAMLPQRRAWAHKGSCGRVLVIAGSRGLTGAAYLASTGALRAGAGLVTLGIGESLHDIMEVKLTEAMTRPLPDKAGSLSYEALSKILYLAARSDAVAIGPGLGTGEDTVRLVLELVRKLKAPLIIDADALNALTGHTEVLREAAVPPILTPHPGELARLTGLSVEQINADRIKMARRYAGEYNAILVLKGAGTVVALPDGQVYINTTGNSGMATGGSGDVLTGIIAGLLAQGLTAAEAAQAGVYVHGRAGDVAAAAGCIGMVAGDLLPAVPAALYGLQNEKEMNG